jgi:protein-tyrosine-phosphatase/DNA-binding HxlR family transcriptional regulator
MIEYSSGLGAPITERASGRAARLSEHVRQRAKVHDALGDPLRLALVDELTFSDRSPAELADRFHIPSNLLAHHVDVLVEVGLVIRTASHGDRRRRYLSLVPDALLCLLPPRVLRTRRVVFVCTANSARSQFAQAQWRAKRRDIPATSGGTRPAAAVHKHALRAAHNAGLDLRGAVPLPVPALAPTDLVVTVCDRAHEELKPRADMNILHWSVPDPVEEGDFEGALAQVRRRIEGLSPHVVSTKESTLHQEEP